MSIFYHGAEIAITLKTQYHIGSGFGLGRVIDSLLRVDSDGVPVIPGTTVSGVVAQGMYDLIDFACFTEEQKAICDFHNHPDNKEKPWLPCGIIKPDQTPCLMCYFFGSPAGEGIVDWMDFPCVTDEELLGPMLRSGHYTGDERQQYIKPYFSHKQNMHTHTVMEKHFFNQEEGAADLKFKGDILFREPLPEDKARYLAAALKNVRAIGRRKSRGKGVCNIEGKFIIKQNGADTSSSLENLVGELQPEKEG